MKRDRVVPLLTGLLALLALPAAGLASLPWLPTTPSGYQALTLLVCALFFLVVPPARRPRALHPALWILAALPFFAFSLGGRGLASAPEAAPQAGWVALVGATWLLAWTRRPAVGAAVLVLLLGGSSVLATAGVGILPPAWNPIGPRSEREPPGASPAREARVQGIRPGAPVRLPAGESPALATGRGPFWIRAQAAERPAPRPVVLVLDGSAAGRPPASLPGATIVPGAEFAFDQALDLGGFDAVIVRSHAWSEADTVAVDKARALVGFVRKGGLLVGPAPGRTWPPELGRALRGSGRGQIRGAAGLEALGLGRVARAETRDDVLELLEEGAWVPEVASRLSEPMPPAPLPGAWSAWVDTPEERRTQGLLLLVYAAVCGTLTWLVRRRGVQALSLLLAAGVVCVALAWMAPEDAGFRVEGLVTDLGGQGGRRCEAVVLSAGRGGYLGRVQWEGGGVFSLHGGQIGADGRLRIAPGRSAWIVREVDALGAAGGGREDRGAAFTGALLLGDADPKRLRYGRLPALPVRVQGAGVVPAWTLTYRPR